MTTLNASLPVIRPLAAAALAIFGASCYRHNGRKRRDMSS